MPNVERNPLIEQENLKGQAQGIRRREWTRTKRGEREEYGENGKRTHRFRVLVMPSIPQVKKNL